MAVAPKSGHTKLLKSVKPVLDRKIVRWYLMFFPFGKKGLTVGLDRELERRKCSGETPFEYFATTYAETKDVDGKLVTTQESLLYNYFFIHCNEDDLFVLKRNQPQYSVLRRVTNSDGSYYYPYVKDSTIKTLKWIARSYGGYIPLYLLDQTLLIKGDRIKITKGQFKGIEAHLVTRPKSTVSQIMVFVDNWMCVPLMNVHPTQYEVIDINDSKEKEKCPHGLDNSNLSQELHDALCRFHKGETTEEDTKLAKNTYLMFSELKADTSILRCKLYSILLPACTILGDKDKTGGILKLVQVMLPKITAEQSLALLMVTLYGCTDNVFYHEKAHQLIESWKREEAPKKSKQILIQRLADYDKCLEH